MRIKNIDQKSMDIFMIIECQLHKLVFDLDLWFSELYPVRLKQLRIVTLLVLVYVVLDVLNHLPSCHSLVA